MDNEATKVLNEQQKETQSNVKDEKKGTNIFGQGMATAAGAAVGTGAAMAADRVYEHVSASAEAEQQAEEVQAEAVVDEVVVEEQQEETVEEVTGDNQQGEQVVVAEPQQVQEETENEQTDEIAGMVEELLGDEAQADAPKLIIGEGRNMKNAGVF